MNKIVGKVLIGIAVFILIFVVGFATLYMRSDLSREELADLSFRFVELPGGASAHYNDQGDPDGPVILLIHGGQSNLHTWESWISRLDKGYRYITVDMPAHGMTGRVPGDGYGSKAMTRFLDEFLTALNIEKVIIGGISMGAAVSLEFTLAHPESVEGLLLMAGGVENTENTAIEKIANAKGIPWYFWLNQNPFLAKWVIPYLDRPMYLYLWLDSPNWKIETVETTKESYKAHDAEVLASRYDSDFMRLFRHQGTRYAQVKMYQQALSGEDAQPDPIPRLGKVNVPTLLQYGELDAAAPVTTGEIIHARIEGSVFKVYQKTGHLVVIEAAEESAMDFMRFLKDHGLDPDSRP